MATAAVDSRKGVQFTVQSARQDGPRLGALSFPNRAPMQTPHYLPVSSKGTVPHITQDNMRDHTGLKSIYAALEDCELPLPCRSESPSS